MKHKKNLIKSAKARVTGTIPYCHGKVPHSRKLLSLCPNDFKGALCSYYLPSFMKFCSVVSEELPWQAISVVYFVKFLSSKGHNSHKI